MRRVCALVIVSMLLLGTVTCDGDPDFVITPSDTESVVYGWVEPFDEPVRVCLIRDSDTVRAVFADTIEGYYCVRGVEYDVYTLHASVGERFADDLLVVDGEVVRARTLRLTEDGDIAVKMTPRSGTTIGVSQLTNDSLFGLRYVLYDRARFDTGAAAVSISPSALARVAETILSADSDTVRVYFPVDSLFGADQLSITLGISVRLGDESGWLSDSLCAQYPIDSTGLDSVLTGLLVDDIHPSVSRRINPEDSIVVEFARAMNRASVESRTSFDPVFDATWFWADGAATIIPANALEPDVRYTVTIGAGAVTADSTAFRTPYTFCFETGDWDFFSSYWPLADAAGVPLNVPFRFSSPYSLEPELLRGAFTIEPAVDSLTFTAGDEPGVVSVSHADLLPGTDYLIRIDSSLSSRKGMVLGERLEIPFTTAAGGQ